MSFSRTAKSTSPPSSPSQTADPPANDLTDPQANPPVMANADDGTHNSGSSLSNLSRSSLEDGTDDFGRHMLKQLRDQKRLRDAANGNVAFRHARPRAKGVLERGALTMENLERSVETKGVEAVAHVEVPARSFGSQSGSDRSEASNAPRTWGRRGRTRNEFLRRIHTADAVRSVDDDEDDLGALWPRRTMYTGDSPSRRRSGDWAALAADVPVPTVEPDSPLSRPHSSHASVPQRRRSDLLNRIMKEDAQGKDRTAVGHKRRSSELNRLREIANVKEMGVTRNRLDELGGNVRRKSEGEHVHMIEEEGRDADVDADADVDVEEQPLDREKPDFEAVRAAANISSVAHRPGHRRQDSRDLLKRIARAASTTPSPTNRRLTSPSQRRIVSSSEQQRDRSPLGGTFSLPTPEQTPQPPPKTAPAQTPHVSGGWIETPAPVVVIDNEVEKTAIKKTEAAIEKSRHARSALEVVLKEAQADKESGQNALGDDTIQSLRGLIAHGESPDNTFDDETLDLINKVTDPVHKAAKDKDEENALLAAMARTLKSTRSSLKDAAKSMRRVEHQVESAETLAHVPKNAMHSCEHCGQGRITLGLLIHQAWAHFLLKFYSWPKGGRFTMTWIGILTVGFVLWFFSEVTLCEIYCHHTTASSMRGTGVDLAAPSPPFVTLTILIKRPFKFVLEPAGYIVAVAIWFVGVGLQYVFPGSESAGFALGGMIKALGTKTALGVVHSFNAGYVYRDERYAFD